MVLYRILVCEIRYVNSDYLMSSDLRWYQSFSVGVPLMEIGLQVDSTIHKLHKALWYAKKSKVKKTGINSYFWRFCSS